MPESFIEDESVPVKWRLYGIINGYWVNGLPVYASNRYFSQRLNCTSRHISRALEVLERDKLINRNVDGYRRLILQGGMTPDVRGGRPGMSQTPDVGGQPNASSIAFNIKSELVNSQPLREEREYEKEFDKPLKPENRTKDKQAVFALFGQKQGWMIHKAQKDAALRLFDQKGLNQIRAALKFYRENKDEKFCPQVRTPYELEEKWSALVSFQKKQ